MPKFFITPDAVKEQTITVSGENAHHMLHVLRLRIGDQVILCDGLETDYRCLIDKIHSKNTMLSAQIIEARSCDTESDIGITLYQSVPKSDKMDWIIQKTVELGIRRIVPIWSERSVAQSRAGRERKWRYQRIAESAAAQSMRGIIPQIEELCSFSESLEIAEEEFKIFAYEREQQQTIKHLLFNQHPNTVGIWIGPEGGFTDKEAIMFQNRGVVPVTLGRRILRTETAGLAALVRVLCVTEV